MNKSTLAALKRAGIVLPGSGPAVPGRFEITIPDFRPATINELTKRGNHFSASRLKRKDREMIATYAIKAGVPKALGRRRVSLRVTLAPRNRTVDPDALHKSLLDALKVAGLLIDDSPDWLEIGRVEQEKGVRLSTTIILEDI